MSRSLFAAASVPDAGRRARAGWPALLAACALLAAPFPSARAADWFVPDDFASIQAAIDAAADGDKIFVRAGEYQESLLVESRTLQVVALDGPGATTLRGAGGSVVTVVQDDSQGLGTEQLFLLAGFTITGGTGTPDAQDPSLTHGGALHLTQIQIGGNEYIRIDDCHIVDNHVTGDGGAVWMDATGVTNAVSSQRNLIAHNSAGRDGGGLFTAEGGKGLQFQHSTIEHNTAGRDGGGVYQSGGGPGFASDSIVRHNHAVRDGGGLRIGGDMTATVVRDNTAGRDGGGVLAVSISGPFGAANSRLLRASLRDNHARRHGGGIAFRNELGPNAKLIFRLSEAIDNHAEGRGGAVHVELIEAISELDFLRDSFVGNTAVEGGAAVWVDAEVDGVMQLQRSVITEHLAADFAGDFVATFETSIVQGGARGDDVVDVDPQFASPAGRILALLPSSPALALGPDELLVGAWASPEFFDTGFGGVHGAQGRPGLSGAGALLPESGFVLTIDRAPADAAAWLVAGAQTGMVPFKGGLLIPRPTSILFVGHVESDGVLEVPARWPANAPSGAVLFTQVAVRDAASASELGLSDGLALIGR